MTVQLNNDGSLAITAMSLVEFLPEIEQAIHNGYMLDLEKNEGVPQQYGSMLVLTMYPVGEVEVSDIESAQVDDDGNRVHTVVQQSQEAVAQVVQDTEVSTKEEQVVKVDGRRKK